MCEFCTEYREETNKVLHANLNKNSLHWWIIHKRVTSSEFRQCYFNYICKPCKWLFSRSCYVWLKGTLEIGVPKILPSLWLKRSRVIGFLFSLRNNNILHVIWWKINFAILICFDFRYYQYCRSECQWLLRA